MEGVGYVPVTSPPQHLVVLRHLHKPQPGIHLLRACITSRHIQADMRNPEPIEMPQQARTHLARIAPAADPGVAGHITQSGHTLALRHNVDACSSHQRIAMQIPT